MELIDKIRLENYRKNILENTTTPEYMLNWFIENCKPWSLNIAQVLRIGWCAVAALSALFDKVAENIGISRDEITFQIKEMSINRKTHWENLTFIVTCAKWPRKDYTIMTTYYMPNMIKPEEVVVDEFLTSTPWHATLLPDKDYFTETYSSLKEMYIAFKQLSIGSK